MEVMPVLESMRVLCARLVRVLFSLVLIVSLSPSVALASVDVSEQAAQEDDAAAAQPASKSLAAQEEQEEATVSSVRVFYRYVDTGDKAKQDKHEYKPDDSSSYPVLYEGRYLVLSAALTLSDGTKVSIAEKSDLWSWKVAGSVDESGRPLSKPLVAVTDDAEVESEENGNGSSKLSFTLEQFPEYRWGSYLTVKTTATPVDKKRPKSVSLSYIDGSHDEPVPYSSSSIPSIAASGNTVQFYATVTFTDGTSMSTETSTTASGFPEHSWSAQDPVDYQGNKLTKLVTSIDGKGKVSALGQGNGLVDISFELDGFPALKQEAQVRLSLDASAAYPTKIALFLDEGLTKPCSASDVQTLKGTKESVHLYAQVVWSDGSKTAAEYGEVKFSIAKTVLADGEETDEALVRLSQSGVVRSLARGNGTVTIKASYRQSASIYATTQVTVEDSLPTIIAMDMDYIDDVDHLITGYDESRDATPQIRSKHGQVQFFPTLVYLSGAVKTMKASEFTWSIEKTTTLAGKASDTSIARTSNGYVFAKGTGDGIVYVRCTYKHDVSVTGLYQVAIRGNSERTWVTKVEVLDSTGKAYGDNAISMDTYGKVQLYARVTYNDGSVLNTYKGDMVDGLEWGPSDIEGASIDKASGQFIATKDFRSARITATVKGGGFYEQDVKGRVWIQIMQSGETGGTPAESLTVKVVYESDYAKDRTKAKTVFDRSYSVAQVKSLMSPKYRTYTFSKGASSRSKWGTLTSYGVSLKDIAREAGVSTSSLVAFRFVTTDNYNPVAYEASDLLGNLYTYPNYSIGKDTGHPSPAGAYKVETSLAIDSWLEYNTDSALSPSDYGKLDSVTRFRLCMGLKSTSDSNSYDTARNVKEIYLIVKDKSYDYDDDKGGGKSDGSGGGSGGGKGSGSGGGKGSGSGGGTGNGKAGGSAFGNGTFTSGASFGTLGGAAHASATALGVKNATAANAGGSGGLASVSARQSNGGSNVDDPSSTGVSPLYLRKLENLDAERQSGLQPEQQNAFMAIFVLVGGLVALLMGGAKSGFAFRRRLAAGEFTSLQGQRKAGDGR